jgi:hypothetical protein
MPKRVEDVRLRIERVRLNEEGVSDPPLLFNFASKWFGFKPCPDSAGDGVADGGVALVMLRSNGRRGVGRKIVGPSEGMMSCSESENSSARLCRGNCDLGQDEQKSGIMG